MGFDQVLEQNNKIIKSRAGLEDLNKSETSFLQRLENVMPEVQDFRERAEQDKSGSPQRHKEAMSSFVKSKEVHWGLPSCVRSVFNKSLFYEKANENKLRHSDASMCCGGYGKSFHHRDYPI